METLDQTTGERVCPRCGHRQQGGEECASCGIIFRRWEEREERRKAAAEAQKNAAAEPNYVYDDRPSGSGGLVRILMLLAVIAATAGLTYTFAMRKQQSAGPVAVEAPVMAESERPRAERPSPRRTTESASSFDETRPRRGGNLVEQARNATVSVITPWGQGSGFFILDTYIVTNKHVISSDSKETKEAEERLKKAKKFLELERQKLARLRRDLGRVPDGPDRRQLVMILKEREADLVKWEEKVREAEEHLALVSKPLNPSDIKIRFADGREQEIYSMRMSSTRDLAILLVTMPNEDVLTPAGERDILRQGDKVFAIGNPRGLSHTVTSGVFSGYREYKETGDLWLQTDAPINPGNSGGPLIDEKGRVHGVNTMVMRDSQGMTQGIGFAIPIQAVFDEFDITT